MGKIFRRKDVKSKILELNSKGYNQMEISKIVARDRSTISKILKKEGVLSARAQGQRGKAKKMRIDMENNIMAVAEYIHCRPDADVLMISSICNFSDDTVYRCLSYMKKYYYTTKKSNNGNESLRNPIYIAAEKRLDVLHRLAYGHVISVLNSKYYKLAINILRMPYIMEEIRKAASKCGEIKKMASMGVEPKIMSHSVPNLVSAEINAARAETAATAATRNERTGWAAVPGPAILELYLLMANKGRYAGEEIMEVAERAVITAGVVNAEMTVKEAIVPRDYKFQIEKNLVHKKISNTLEDYFDMANTEYEDITRIAALRVARESFVYGKKALGRKSKYSTISQLVGYANKWNISYIRPRNLDDTYAMEGDQITRATAWGLLNALT